jgi:hypothetical protein
MTARSALACGNPVRMTGQNRRFMKKATTSLGAQNHTTNLRSLITGTGLPAGCARAQTHKTESIGDRRWRWRQCGWRLFSERQTKP